MSRKTNQSSTDGGVQVFELTMDNPEDQDELNRRLRKPGEPDQGASLKGQPSSNGPTGKERGRGDV